jgi:hypothetical protein
MADTKTPRGSWIPSTPAGTLLPWLEAPTEAKAWANLLKDAAHMPYRGIEGFKRRGYTVDFWEEVDG